ncbi:MAG: hypothetical protein EHM35_11060, partial [Planctomycetaceae bacterium]
MNAKINGLMARTVVLLSFWASLLYAQPYQFAGGTGEPNDPYQIATAEQLISIGSDPNLLDKHFILLNDIDLDPNLPGGRAFTQAVIAPSEDRYYLKGTPFTGTFSGHGHSIKNLTFERASLMDIRDFIGLFGNVAKGGLVSDLKVEDANLKQHGGSYYSPLAAWNEGRIVRCGVTGKIDGNGGAGMVAGFNRGEIIGCWAEGDVSGRGDIGGLVGFNSYGAILNSHASTVVHITGGYTEIPCPGGGLVGQSLGGEIVNCWATGDVSARFADCLGGLVGLGSEAVIANSYATGSVSADNGRRLGGLAGSASTVNDCYATGSVSTFAASSIGGLVGGTAFVTNSYAIGRTSGGYASQNVGGLVGDTAHSEIEGCFWNFETTAPGPAGGGIASTTAEMQDAATYLAAGWDFAGERENGTVNLWFIPEGGGYPLLTVHSDAFEPHKLEGAGTQQDPYRIGTVEDLDAINHYDLTAYYRLEADINLAQSVRKTPV